MEVPAKVMTLSKVEAATRQVEAAIEALIRGDFDIAITLAGAAEGMLMREGPHMFSFLRDAPHAQGLARKQEWIATLNLERDWLKHPVGPDQLSFDADSAAYMVARAASKLEKWSPNARLQGMAT